MASYYLALNLFQVVLKVFVSFQETTLKIICKFSDYFVSVAILAYLVGVAPH